MADRLLRKEEIAAMLGTSPGVAASILAEHGCQPIDFGRGKWRGPRWLESAVVWTIRRMHTEAQPQPKSPAPRKAAVISELNLAQASAKELENMLTAAGPAQ